MSCPSIFITGAATGIGKACAQHFHGRGWHVGLYDVDAAGCSRLATTLGGQRCSSGRLDVTDADAWRSTLAEFWQQSGGRLDVLLNNAGILASGPLQEIDLSRQHAIVDVNLKGVINGCHLAFDYLQQTPDSRVINLASASAIYGTPRLATYSATKFAVRGLTEALDLEWRGHGIRVMDIWPLFVQTNMIDQLDGAADSVSNMGVKLDPADVARTVFRAATHQGGRRPHWPVGRDAALLSRLIGWLPGPLTRAVMLRVSGG